MRPHGEHQVAGVAEERFVHHEFLIAMLMKTLHAGPIPPHAVHARRGIAANSIHSGSSG